ncbi:hypothetical protein AVEN_146541-1 [Araneus ventricosus]|uniref:Uncharacterized protein n=1 Tax=Araneus ventricosus TaxID=182803 RepID=A0A4Y2WP41_ARAVE|nr:hypothetical protein AVEN_146541-1 [Araneus ventricosus]
MTRTTPELAPPSPNFHATPTGGRLTTTYDLTCNRPHTRRIFSGIGSRTWNPPAQHGWGKKAPNGSNTRHFLARAEKDAKLSRLFFAS